MPDATNAGNTAGTIIYLILVIAFYVLLVIADWKIFSKAGEDGWKSLIPIYNLYIYVKIMDGKGVKFLLLLIPIAGFIYEIMLMLRTAKAFGKSTGFAVGLILLPNIFTLILGFGDAQYIGPQGPSVEQ